MNSLLPRDCAELNQGFGSGADPAAVPSIPCRKGCKRRLLEKIDRHKENRDRRTCKTRLEYVLVIPERIGPPRCAVFATDEYSVWRTLFRNSPSAPARLHQL